MSITANSHPGFLARSWNHLDLFKVGTDNNIYSTWWHDTSGWAPWFVISGGTASPGSTVTAISRISDHMDVFAVGADGKAISCWWDKGAGWASWFPVSVS